MKPAAPNGKVAEIQKMFSVAVILVCSAGAMFGSFDSCASIVDIGPFSFAISTSLYTYCSFVLKRGRKSPAFVN